MRKYKYSENVIEIIGDRRANTHTDALHKQCRIPNRIVSHFGGNGDVRVYEYIVFIMSVVRC